MKTCLTIAGSDSSGGAGIQADLKTFCAHQVYGMSAVTAITAQNTLGVNAVAAVDPILVAQQIQAVFDDIPPNAVKIGMLANCQIVETVAEQLSAYGAKNVVLDPVMIATSGDTLLDKRAIRVLVDRLIPQADIITPNTAELLTLCRAQGIKIDSNQPITHTTVETLSMALFESLPVKENGNRVSLLSKGGHLKSDQSNDFLVTENSTLWFDSKRVNTQNSHGTGCTLAAAICAQLALGKRLDVACKMAKEYLSNALAKNLNLGNGNGPLNHQR